MEVPLSWEGWKNTLGTAINVAETVGISEDTVKNAAYRLGNFLADKIDPSSRENRLLKELWDAGNEQERTAMTSMLVKMLNARKPAAPPQ
ncbi:MAG: DUF3243 domain-containing protein [Clostridia bacterium]|nr:MAG: DUF3243 domain-containing protein [Clostridia bacterium]